MKKMQAKISLYHYRLKEKQNKNVKTTKSKNENKIHKKGFQNKLQIKICVVMSGFEVSHPSGLETRTALKSSLSPMEFP